MRHASRKQNTNLTYDEGAGKCWISQAGFWLEKFDSLRWKANQKANQRLTKYATQLKKKNKLLVQKEKGKYPNNKIS